MYSEGALEPSERRILEQARRQDSLMTVRSLTSFPGDATLVIQAYAQSRELVAYLVESYELARFHALLDALASGETTIDQALMSAYGFDQAGLYTRWRASLGLPSEPRVTPSARRRQPDRAPCAIPLVVPLAMAYAAARHRMRANRHARR
jgi:hypothetical protein